MHSIATNEKQTFNNQLLSIFISGKWQWDRGEVEMILFVDIIHIGMAIVIMLIEKRFE